MALNEFSFVSAADNSFFYANSNPIGGMFDLKKIIILK